jgi:uncharacterized protein YwqG
MPSVEIHLDMSAEDEPPVGSSRVGGLPDAPPGFEWPTWRVPNLDTPPGEEQRYLGDGPAPLDFIAQIRLADLKGIEAAGILPDSGWLWFFHDTQEPWVGSDYRYRDSFRVLYFEGDESALRRVEELPDPDRTVFAPRSARFSPGWTLPHTPPPWREAWFGGEDMEQHFERCRAWRTALEPLYTGGTGGVPIHRLLGHPQEIQGPMETDCQIAAGHLDDDDFECAPDEVRAWVEEGAADWILLLQVDTDGDIQWESGEDGRLFYWIRRQDIARRDFSQVWCVFQIP